MSTQPNTPSVPQGMRVAVATIINDMVAMRQGHRDDIIARLLAAIAPHVAQADTLSQTEDAKRLDWIQKHAIYGRYYRSSDGFGANLRTEVRFFVRLKKHAPVGGDCGTIRELIDHTISEPLSYHASEDGGAAPSTVAYEIESTPPSLPASDAESNRLRGEVERLQNWKEQALAVEAEWNSQAVGKLLGVPLGHSIRRYVQPAIESLRARVAELEKERDEACKVLTDLNLGPSGSKPVSKEIRDGLNDLNEAAAERYSKLGNLEKK